MKLYSNGATLYNPRRIAREPGETRRAYEARKKQQQASATVIKNVRFYRLVNFTAWFWRFMGMTPYWLEQ